MMERLRGWRVGANALGALCLVLASEGLAWADDSADAAAILAQLDRDTAHRPWTEGAMKAARDALERATRMRHAGDELHARLAEGLALEWAETAADLGRAADAEKKQRELEVSAIEAGGRVERERALLEEAIARSGRLKTELEAAHQQASKPKERTSPLGHTPEPPKKAPAAPTDADAPAPKAASPVTRPAGAKR